MVFTKKKDYKNFELIIPVIKIIYMMIFDKRTKQNRTE